MTNRFLFGVLLSAAALVTGCGDMAKLPPQADMGAQLVLLVPVKQLLPNVNIAPAKSWPEGVLPQPMAGLRVTALARGLDHPRWVYVLPNGNVTSIQRTGGTINKLLISLRMGLYARPNKHR